MSKERIIKVEAGYTSFDSTRRSFTIIAKNPGLEILIRSIQNLSRKNPNSFILVLTPKITASQVESFFEAGAITQRNWTDKETQDFNEFFRRNL